jgi:hypothetical protein
MKVTSQILNVLRRDLLFRAFSASGIVMTFTQGVALGYHIARLWRCEPGVFTQAW